MTGKTYVYKGDRMTDPTLKGLWCVGVIRGGKCVTGRSAMLVQFGHRNAPDVVQRRFLRKVTPLQCAVEFAESGRQNP